MAKSTKPVWILCPRCELNYIKKADQYCNVCKKELKLIEEDDARIAKEEEEKRLAEEEAKKPKPIPEDIALLTEIRDLLKK